MIDDTWDDPTADDYPRSYPAEPRQRDQSRFEQLLARLSDWRTADHEDNFVLCRSEVIEIIEGVENAQWIYQAADEIDRLQRALQQIAKEVFTDGTPTKAARIALAALAVSRPPPGGAT